jgi:hypothetical protein
MTAAVKRQWPWFAISLSALFALLACGCNGTVPPGAYVFKTQASKAVEDAANRFGRFDTQEQERILHDSAPSVVVADLKNYDETIRKPSLIGFQSFQGALGAYGAALDAAKAGLRADWLGLGFILVKAGIELTETLKRLKVPINFNMPSFLLGGAR